MTRNSPSHGKIDRPAGYEESDVSAPLVGLFGLGLMLALVLSIFSIAAFVTWLAPARGPTVATGFPPAEAGPRLQVDPAAEHARIEAEARARLTGYSWMDSPHGRAHIPIERAMAILARDGWPREDRP